MTPEEMFWRGLASMVGIAGLIVLLVPDAAEWFGRLLLAHAQALRAAQEAYRNEWREARR